MATHLHLDGFSGISGDMFLGALVDVGLSWPLLKRNLRALNLSGYRLESKLVHRGTIQATKINVRVQKGFARPLSLSRIRQIITKSPLPDAVKTQSLQVFDRLAEAEGRVHGLPLSKVHFHEVGVLDSFVDVVGGILGCHLLGVTHVSASPVNLGSGFIKTAHGVLPVPGPAVTELAKQVPVVSEGPQQEMTTPTGIGLLTTLTQQFTTIPPFLYEAIGYGAGTADPPGWPNVLRVFLGQAAAASYQLDQVVQVETTIDDLNPQIYEMLIDQMFAAGALDVRLTPVIMKRSRPGIIVTALAKMEKAQAMAQRLFRETSTLGVRVQPMTRYILPRTEEMVHLPQGTVRVKKAPVEQTMTKWIPEYRDCQAIAVKAGQPVREVIQEVMHVLKTNKKRESKKAPRS